MSAENISLLQQVRESINTSSTVDVDATGCRISDIMAQLNVMDGVDKVRRVRNADGIWCVCGARYGWEFQLHVTCND